MHRELPSRTADIFLLPKDDRAAPHLVTALETLLDAAERARAEALRCAEARRAFVCAHALLRSVLAQACKTGVDEVVFERGDAKPRMAGARTVEFSLSHTHGLVGCAAAVSPVGFDVEVIRSVPEALAIAERHFAAPEAAALRSLPEPQRLHRFFRHWTLKEAWLKACGQGLLGSLADPWFEIDGPGAVTRHGALGRAHRFLSFAPLPTHCLALATTEDIDHVRVWWVDVELNPVRVCTMRMPDA